MPLPDAMTNRATRVSPRGTSVCVISFSPLARDARVLRQIETCARHYDVVVIGFDDTWHVPEMPSNVTWRLMPGVTPTETTAAEGRQSYTLLVVRIWEHVPSGVKNRLYDWLFWTRPRYREALRLACSEPHSAYVANEWNALPVAIAAASRTGGRVLFDAHEFSPLENESDRYWMAVRGAMSHAILERYARKSDACTTVAPAIADRLHRDYGVSPKVVYNAPHLQILRNGTVDPDGIRLIHHGIAAPTRRPEKMIEALALADTRFTLTFMFSNAEETYVQQLMALAEKLAPNRIHFRPPVKPAEIVTVISEYDLGLYVLEPTSYNDAVALPNKFFDFLVAGLGIVVGPSNSMAELVKKYACGIATSSFEVRSVASALNQLQASDVTLFKQAAREAARDINAGTEMSKLLAIVDRLCKDAVE